MIVVDSRLPLLLGSAATSLSCSLFCFENQMYSWFVNVKMDSIGENKSDNAIAVNEVDNSASTQLSKRALKKLKKRQE